MKRESEEDYPCAARRTCTVELAPTVNETDMEIDEHESIYAWPYVINNFSKMMKRQKGAISSSPFTVGTYKLQINVFPQGDGNAHPNYISIFLELIRPSKAVLSFTISILDLNGIKKYSISSESCYYDLRDQVLDRFAYGEAEFIKPCDLMTNVLAMTNDQLIILCEVKNPDSFGLPHEIQILRSYKAYLNNEEFSDVKIIVNNKTIFAHKIILSSNNEVFAAMLKSDMKEGRDNEVIIEDIDYEVMMELIRFIYIGQVHKIERMAEKLLIAADRYAVIELKLQCARYLGQILSHHNVLDYLALADRYCVDKLKSAATTFFLTHRKEIVNTRSFPETIKSLRPELIADLMKDLGSL